MGKRSVKTNARKAPKVEDLTMKKANAKDVVGGAVSLSYTKIEQTYTQQDK